MKKNQLKLGIYLSYLSIFISNITNLILTPFIIKNLGQSEYGLYMLIGAFIGYITILDFGLSNTTIRFISKYRALGDKKGEQNFLFTTLIIYIFISICVLLVGIILFLNLDLIFSNSLNEEELKLAKSMFIILVISLAFALPMNFFTGIIMAYEKFIFPRSITIFKALIRISVLLILLSMGYKSLAIVIVDSILNILMMVLSILYVFLKLKIKIFISKIDSKLIKEIFYYSSLIFVSAVVDQIYWRIGHLILGIIASTSDVAIFAITMMFCQYFITFSSAISGVFLPKVTQMVVRESSDDSLTNLLIKTGRIQFLVLGFVLGGFLLFGKEFIVLWAGPEFSYSWNLALIIIVPLTIVLTQTIGISILQAKNLHGIRAIIYLIIAVINTILSIYLVEIFGSLGAATGTALSLILGNLIFMNLYYHFKVKLNMIRFYKELSSGLVLSFIISLLIGSVIKELSIISWYSLVIYGFIYAVIYFFTMWTIGMNPYERTLFNKEFSKVLNLINKKK